MPHCMHLFSYFFRFVQYNPTSLERNYKHELLTEVDLGVPIDLILPETYSVDRASGRDAFVMCIASKLDGIKLNEICI